MTTGARDTNRAPAIKFIINNMIPREGPEDIDGSWCCKVEKPYQYPIEQLPSMHMHLWMTNDIQTMIHMVKSGPVTACLSIFAPDYQYAQDTKHHDPSISSGPSLGIPLSMMNFIASARWYPWHQ
ncbi:unnamed protein product, partial [Arabidopsis halleri]